jgi:hypothetical protein
MIAQTLEGWLKETANSLLVTDGSSRQISKLVFLTSADRKGWNVKLEGRDGMILLSDEFIDQEDLSRRYTEYLTTNCTLSKFLLSCGKSIFDQVVTGVRADLVDGSWLLNLYFEDRSFASVSTNSPRSIIVRDSKGPTQESQVIDFVGWYLKEMAELAMPTSFNLSYTLFEENSWLAAVLRRNENGFLWSWNHPIASYHYHIYEVVKDGKMVLEADRIEND